MATFKINGSTAFVTGTNKPNGIGQAIVRELIAHGAQRVYATARSASQLESLVNEFDGKVVAVSLDVTDDAAIAKLGELYSDVNLVINNAGVFNPSSVLEGADGAATEIAVNYTGPLRIVQSFQQALLAASNSAVVNINSIASLVNFPLGGTYSASKAAAHSLTQAQRRELAGSLVVGVYPGPIDTAMAEKIEMEKTPPSAVGAAVADALEQGVEDVFPDPMSQQLFEGWKHDAKALERQMSQPSEAAE